MKNILGYVVGFLIFVVLVPFVMFFVSPEINFSVLKLFFFAFFAGVGIAISIWSIVYMYFVGKGNPLDAFNYDVAPRTSALMIKGPYKICRNPMLFGILIYYIGIVIFLNSYQSLLIFIIFSCVMFVQLYFEEKRLVNDFGADYIEYKKSTKKLIPFIW